MHFVFCSSASDRILRSYKRSLNGFAARLTEQQANKLAGMDPNFLPSVVDISPVHLYFFFRFAPTESPNLDLRGAT